MVLQSTGGCRVHIERNATEDVLGLIKERRRPMTKYELYLIYIIMLRERFLPRYIRHIPFDTFGWTDMHAVAILPQVKVLLSNGLIATSSQDRTALNVIVRPLNLTLLQLPNNPFVKVSDC